MRENRIYYYKQSKRKISLFYVCFAIYFNSIGIHYTYAGYNSKVDSLQSLLSNTYGPQRELLLQQIGWEQEHHHAEEELRPHTQVLERDVKILNAKITGFQLQRNILVGGMILVILAAGTFSYFQRGKFKKYIDEEPQDSYDNEQARRKEALVNAKLREANEAVLFLQRVLEEKKSELLAAIALRNEQQKLIEKQNEQLTQVNSELQVTIDEVRTQKEIVAEHNAKIQDSIEYALKIQQAILPDAKVLQEKFPKHFIFYRPKDVISGDFYWSTRHENRLYFAVVDCTGHGVPGAFMSVIGASLLNQLVNERGVYEPEKILYELDKNVRSALRQHQDSTSKDGMDLMLCAFDYDRAEVIFSGANRPLYHLHGQTLTEYKGDKFPIGGNQYAEKTFTRQRIDLTVGDRFYLFTDGVTDQFGGSAKRKFSPKRLQDFILTHTQTPMLAQLDLFVKEFDGWQGKFHQLDDITLAGIEL